MVPNFEADLTPPEAGFGNMWPRVRFNFDNGWSASLVLRTDETGMNAQLAALAACPTGQWKRGKTELGEQEASPDEVIGFLAEVAARPRPQRRSRRRTDGKR
jgi:hypothetical protein